MRIISVVEITTSADWGETTVTRYEVTWLDKTGSTCHTQCADLKEVIDFLGIAEIS